MSFMNLTDQSSDPASPPTGKILFYSKNGLLTTVDSLGVVRIAMGDMVQSTYDPTGVSADAFDMSKMVEATNQKVFSLTERTSLSNVQVANSVYIKTLSDFPTPVAGKINLVLGTTYFIYASINIGTNNFVIPTTTNQNINFMGGAFNHVSITYEGSGVMFENVGGINAFNSFDMIYSNTGSGTFMNPTSSANPLAQVALLNTLIIGFASVGTWSIRLVFLEGAFVDNIAGIFLDNVIDFRIDNCLMINNSDLGTKFITVNGTGTTTGLISKVTFTTQASETAIDIDSTISTASLIRIEGNSFVGSGTALDATGISESDDRIKANGNEGVSDSQTLGESYLSTQEIVTINTTSVPEVIGGTNWVNGVLERITSTSGGRLTYTGRDPITVFIKGQATVEQQGGGADLVELCIVKNGVQVPQPCFGTENATATALSASAIIEIVKDDYFELYVSNETDTSNIIVSQALIEFGKT